MWAKRPIGNYYKLMLSNGIDTVCTVNFFVNVTGIPCTNGKFITDLDPLYITMGPPTTSLNFVAP